MLTIYLDVQGVLQSIDAIKNHKQTGDVNGLSFLNNELFVENEKVDFIRKFCIDNNA